MLIKSRIISSLLTDEPRVIHIINIFCAMTACG